ncbi:cell division protein FtsK, partial [Kineococcus sp. T13]|uniref:FtsK/SpoIIIE domain-containing protein n=1 Tax=Kineococcus vitellinus TaxID=2696565 RepID=UPI00196B3A39
VLAWGLLDVPAEQRRASAGWDLAAGEHLLVVGTVRSGRSTLLRTLAAQAARCAVPVEVHVLDAGGRLGDLAGTGCTGSVVGREEVWRAGRLLQRLQEEVERRRARFARAGVPDLPAEHARARAAGEALEPYLVLLVDGWDSFAGALADAEPGCGADALLRLLREASAVGVRVALTGDRALLTGAVASACGQVLLLRLADRADAALLGLRAAELPRAAPPGRGVLVREGVAQEVQVLEPATVPGPWAGRPVRARAPAP